MQKACDEAGLKPVHVRVVNRQRPPDFPRGLQYEDHLSVLIVGSRWVEADGYDNLSERWLPAPQHAADFLPPKPNRPQRS